jgi:hypothetical protein
MGQLDDLVKEFGARKVVSDEEELARRALEEFDQDVDDRTRRLERAGATDLLTAEDHRMLVRVEFEPTKYIQGAMRFLEGDRSVLALLGDVGRGKTLAAMWLVTELGGQFRTAAVILDLWTRRGWKAAEERDRLIESRLLVIDDVGQGTPPSDFVPILTSIINSRRSPKRRTVLTGNFSVNRFKERFGDKDPRLSSRLHQSAVAVEDIGDDMRRIE